VARSQLDAVVGFLEQLSHGGEIHYDGEDREWLLTLTGRASISIGATSRGTPGPDGSLIDEGLWNCAAPASWSGSSTPPR
jgi:hypothetical protein